MFEVHDELAVEVKELKRRAELAKASLKEAIESFSLRMKDYEEHAEHCTEMGNSVESAYYLGKTDVARTAVEWFNSALFKLRLG